MRKRDLRSYTDEQLAVEVSKTSHNAFDELYRRYSRRMLHYFFRMLGHDEEKAQDFVQELFLKLVQKAHTFDAGRSFSTWLYTMAANMCKNEYRSLQVRSIMVRESEDWDQYVGEVDRVEKQVESQQFGICLKRELESLGPKHREVFVLRFQNELSIKEIADVLNCSEGTVKSRIFYALKKLSHCLKAFDPSPS